MPHDSKGDAQRQSVVELLKAAEAHPISFWWRDDDAETAAPALDQLLTLARRHDLPLALAVVPQRATTALADRLAGEPKVAVLQHGWNHANHSPPTEKKMELDRHRPLEAVLADLERGYHRLAGLVPERFLPVLVPPWNRIADPVREARRGVGLSGLSTSGPAPADAPHWVNVHFDIFEWKPRRPLTRAEAYAALASELERRVGGDPEPIGIMTHHLVHEEQSWDFLDELFGLTARHPAIKWPAVGELFGLR